MNEQQDDNEPEFEDPEEQQRFENEIMKLKLQAEHGAVIGGDLSELPPGVEAEFLKNIFAFQETIGSNAPVSMLEALGNPTLPPAESMDADRLESAWETLDEMLDEHGFAVDFLAEYPTETKYRFVTEELVHKPVMWPMPEGMTMHTIYEEFHPNHKWDLENRTRNFIGALLENNGEVILHHLAPELTDGAEGRLEAEDVLPMTEAWLQRFGEVLDWTIEPEDTRFDLEEKEVKPTAGEQGEPESEAESYTELSGVGHCAGQIRIVVRRPDGGEETISGPFKLFFEMTADWWAVFHFVVPGWNWRRR